MEGKFNIYEFVRTLRTIQPDEVVDMFFIPFCIVLAALCVGQFVNRLIESKLENRYGDNDISFRYILMRAARGIPRAWIVGFTIYWLINSTDLEWVAVDLLSYVLSAWLSFTVFQVLARAATGFVELYAARHDHIPQTSLLPNIINVVIYSLGILLILSSMGVSVAPVLTAMGIGGMAIALGLQETLSNICAGLYLLMSKQLSINDYVRLSTGEEGRVADITWRFTTIISVAGNAIVVPNQSISSAIITNYCMPERDMAIKVACGVAYDSDLDFVEEVTLEVAESVMEKLGEPIRKKPSVLFHTFNDSSIDFNVVLHCSQFADQFKLKHEFIKALTKRYRQENIEIPFPIRTVYNNQVK